MYNYIPKRNIGVWFSIDANRINARQNDKSMNQLEEWADKEVIDIYISEPAAIEVKKGGSLKRHKKLSKFGPISLSLADTQDEKVLLLKIADILYGRLPKNENEWRDIEIVFNSKKYCGNLITEDGGSLSQPSGILGKRSELKSLGITVYRTAEAVELVRSHIQVRDDNVRYFANRLHIPLPNWVGMD
jgi:hypothetical protein